MVLGVGVLFYVYAKISLPDAPPGPRTTNVYDRNGTLITTLHAEVDRTPIKFEDMPLILRQAVIASEDKDFYKHKGVSAFGILRAAWADLRHRRVAQGGSTITQQYVKLVYTGGERTILRKIKEGVLALKLEHKYSKDEILRRYLNTIYLGRGAYGVQAASKLYFHKDAKALNLNEAATLAGIIPAPESYNPITQPLEARRRRNEVLDRMEAEGYIRPEQTDATKATAIKPFRKSKPLYVAQGNDFVKYLRSTLIEKYGRRETFTGGLNVRTTLDLNLQRAAEDAVADHLPNETDPDSALVAIDPRNGHVVAMVGGRGTNSTDFNFATDGTGRQPGSSFKPFTFAAAMEAGVSPYSVWNGPSSITIDDPTCDTGGEPWQPSNAGDSGHGTLSLLSATALSVNTIFAQVVTQVRPASVVELAQRAGIRSTLEPFCGIALGSEEVHPLEMANAYATFAAHGMWHEATPIGQITRDGTKIQVARQPPDQTILPQNADLTTYAMEGVVQYGTGTAAAIGRPVAGKTGTTNDSRDAWFCGYTPQLVTCVWVGYKTPAPMHDIGGYSTIYGGTIPAAIWHDFMSVAMDGQPVEDFAEPDFTGKDCSAFCDGSIDETTPPSPSPTPSPTQTIPSPPPPPTTDPPTTPPTTEPPTTPPTTPPPSPGADRGG
jgi:penicillin-binding protein 1A